MNQGLLCGYSRPIPPLIYFRFSSSSSICRHRLRLKCCNSTDFDSINGGQLTAKERRQLRNERRESKTSNWREQVEERLLHKPKKKRYTSWTEELNLDNLSRLGLQWWLIRTSRASTQETAERLAVSLARSFPDIEFLVYCPAVHVNRKLKNGSYSVKANPLFPGCIFIRCMLNKEIHDFIRDWDGVGGFLGSKVGNKKRMINKPKPLPVEEMEAIFRQAKEEQEAADQAFKETQRLEGIAGDEVDSNGRDARKSVVDGKPKRRSRKGSEGSLLMGENEKLPVLGSSVKVLSGPFSEFTGCLKELNSKTGAVKVGFMLFGKESFVDLQINQIVAESR